MLGELRHSLGAGAIDARRDPRTASVTKLSDLNLVRCIENFYLGHTPLPNDPFKAQRFEILSGMLQGLDQKLAETRQARSQTLGLPRDFHESLRTISTTDLKERLIGTIMSDASGWIDSMKQSHSAGMKLVADTLRHSPGPPSDTLTMTGPAPSTTFTETVVSGIRNAVESSCRISGQAHWLLKEADPTASESDHAALGRNCCQLLAYFGTLERVAFGAIMRQLSVDSQLRSNNIKVRLVGLSGNKFLDLAGDDPFQGLGGPGERLGCPMPHLKELARWIDGVVRFRITGHPSTLG